MTAHAPKDRALNKLLFWSALCSTLVGWAPLFAGLISSATAAALGCEVNEAYARPCILMGTDISNALYNGFMSMFLLIFTAPIIMISFVLWIIFAVVTVRPKRSHGAVAAASKSSSGDRNPA